MPEIGIDAELAKCEVAGYVRTWKHAAALRQLRDVQQERDAARADNAALVRLLIDHGVCVNHRDGKEIEYCAYCGHSFGHPWPGPEGTPVSHAPTCPVIQEHPGMELEQQLAAARVGLVEIADAPRLTSQHEYAGELCEAKWTAEVAAALLAGKAGGGG